MDVDISEQPQANKLPSQLKEGKHDSRRVIRPGKILLLKLPSGTVKTIDAVCMLNLSFKETCISSFICHPMACLRKIL